MHLPMICCYFFCLYFYVLLTVVSTERTQHVANTAIWKMTFSICNRFPYKSTEVIGNGKSLCNLMRKTENISCTSYNQYFSNKSILSNQSAATVFIFIDILIQCNDRLVAIFEETNKNKNHSQKSDARNIFMIYQNHIAVAWCSRILNYRDYVARMMVCN